MREFYHPKCATSCYANPLLRQSAQTVNEIAKNAVANGCDVVQGEISCELGPTGRLNPDATEATLVCRAICTLPRFYDQQNEVNTAPEYEDSIHEAMSELLQSNE